jgi:heptaprenylglyceryl phosphate synthase
MDISSWTTYYYFVSSEINWQAIAQTAVLCVSVSNTVRYSTDYISFPQFINSRQQSFHKQLHINQTTKIILLYVHSTVLLDLVNCL